MTCRVARSFQNYSKMEPVSCCEYGSTLLEEFLTSKALGPHLCQLCAQATVECGTSVESQPQPPMMRGHLVA